MLASAITCRAQQRSAKAASDPKTPVPQKMPNKNLKTNVREGGNHPEKKGHSFQACHVVDGSKMCTL